MKLSFGLQNLSSQSVHVPFHRQISALTVGPPPPPRILPPGMSRPSLEKDRKLDEQQDFTFHDLPQVQSIEEKTNEALLVLDSNINVMTELKEHYDSLVASEEWPKELATHSSRESMRFSKRITRNTAKLRMHRSRTETLLRLLSERKNLLYGILQFHSMEASNWFTKKAQESADKMEKVTVEMHEIASKTKLETVSMKIITVVTLFFLPGTFMSVT